MRARRIPKRHPPVWGLIGLTLVAITHAVAYSPLIDHSAGYPRGMGVLNSLVPMWVLSVGWFIAAAGILTAVVRGRPGWAAVGALVTMMLLWGGLYGIAWIVLLTQGVSTIGYLLSGVYIGLGLYVMGNVPPDPPDSLPPEDH